LSCSAPAGAAPNSSAPLAARCCSGAELWLRHAAVSNCSVAPYSLDGGHAAVARSSRQCEACVR
jgi:hypothetical protein